MFDDADLHRNDVQLLVGFFTDHMLTATAGTGQFMLRQFVDDFDTLQIRRQRLAFTTRVWSVMQRLLKSSNGRIIRQFIAVGIKRKPISREYKTQAVACLDVFMHSNHVSIQGGASGFAWVYAIFIVSGYESGLLRSDCSSKRLVMLDNSTHAH